MNLPNYLLLALLLGGPLLAQEEKQPVSTLIEEIIIPAEGVSTPSPAPLSAPVPKEPEKAMSISSDQLRVETIDDKQCFYFEKNVTLDAQGLSATCDHMEAFSQKEMGAQGIMEFGQIEWIKGSGHVHIEQYLQKGNTVSKRVATAGKAELFPAEGKIVLSGSPRPVVTDEKGKVEGVRITLFKDKGQILVEGDEQMTRPTITLTSISLGSAMDTLSNKNQTQLTPPAQPSQENATAAQAVSKQ